MTARCAIRALTEPRPSRRESFVEAVRRMVFRLIKGRRPAVDRVIRLSQGGDLGSRRIVQRVNVIVGRAREIIGARDTTRYLSFAVLHALRAPSRSHYFDRPSTP